MSSPPTDTLPAPLPILTFLPANIPSFRCAACTVEVALQDELVSRSFSGASGPAYLVRSTVNTTVGEKVVKQLLTGRHTIASLACHGCGTVLGWTYFTTPDTSQKYKEGKSILEKDCIYKDNKWVLSTSPDGSS